MGVTTNHFVTPHLAKQRILGVTVWTVTPSTGIWDNLPFVSIPASSLKQLLKQKGYFLFIFLRQNTTEFQLSESVLK